MPSAEYYIGMAFKAAEASKDTTKVGAVLVRDGSIILTAYNGPPKGVEDRPERFERPAKYDWICHAEENLISFAASNGIATKGCTVYVTHQPCSRCAGQMINAGIARLVYAPGKTSMAQTQFDVATTMISEAGIVVDARK